MAAAILAATLLLPVAAGAPAEGLFTVEGEVRVPSGAYLETTPLGIFLGGTKQADPPLDFTSFLIQADSLELVERTKKRAAASIPIRDQPATLPSMPGSDTVSSRTLRNVTITIEGTLGKGYVAIENTSSTSHTSLLGAGPAALASVTRSDFSSSNISVGEGVDANPAYYRIVSSPHALVSAPGELSFEGEGKMKLYGMTLALSHDESDQGDDRIRTGGWYETEGGLEESPEAGFYIQSWVIITGGNLRFQASSPQGWKLAGGETLLDWHGAAAFRATSGTLETPSTVYGASRSSPILLDGTFQATLETVGVNTVSSRLQVTGDLDQTNLPVTQTKAVLPTPGGASTLLWVGLIVGVAVAAGGVVQWRRRAGSRAVAAAVVPAAPEPILSPAMAAEYYVGLAEQALQFDDHAKALHWISLAREASPTSSDVATTMAYVLGELGEYDEALAMYEEASRLDPSEGEADLNAARLAARAGKPAEVIEALVLRALDRSPEFVFDVEEDLEFRPLAVRASFREALARAWDRWSGGRPAVSR